MNKITALSEFLGCDAAEVTESDIDIYSYGGQEYLVLTDVEANEKTRDYMKLSVKGIIDDFDFFVSDSVLSDATRADILILGRYPKQNGIHENEIGNFFVYRVN